MLRGRGYENLACFEKDWGGKNGGEKAFKDGEEGGEKKDSQEADQEKGCAAEECVREIGRDMCTGCFPDDIIVCPLCKRDDEGYKAGDSASPFTDEGGGLLRCLCGHLFSRAEVEGHVAGDS